MSTTDESQNVDAGWDDEEPGEVDAGQPCERQDGVLSGTLLVHVVEQAGQLVLLTGRDRHPDRDGHLVRHLGVPAPASGAIRGG